MVVQAWQEKSCESAHQQTGIPEIEICGFSLDKGPQVVDVYLLQQRQDAVLLFTALVGDVKSSADTVKSLYIGAFLFIYKQKGSQQLNECVLNCFDSY